jgi:hypothetical protein
MDLGFVLCHASQPFHSFSRELVAQSFDIIFIDLFSHKTIHLGLHMSFCSYVLCFLEARLEFSPGGCGYLPHNYSAGEDLVNKIAPSLHIEAHTCDCVWVTRQQWDEKYPDFFISVSP